MHLWAWASAEPDNTPRLQANTMHKTPSQIARSLRAFRNMHRLGLLRAVRIRPGFDACEAARSQRAIEYAGAVVPRLPLQQCTRDLCQCKYMPLASSKLRRLWLGGGDEPSRASKRKSKSK
jgi:hypothetical protein